MKSAPCHLRPMRGALALCLVAACGPKAAAPGKPAGSAAEGPVVARVDDRTITLADLQQRIDALDPYSKARYSSPEQKKKFLENLVAFEVLVKEAQRKGYDKDPDVQRVLKNQMVDAFWRKELDEKLKGEPISDAEIEQYYRQHEAQFRQAEEVRVSQILVKDRKKADEVASEARATGKTDKAFLQLVAKHSEDEDSKRLGGDLTFFARTSTQYPKPLVEAAFAIPTLGDVAGPIATDQGFHILRLTQRRPGFTRPLAEVTREIRRLILRDRRAKKMEAMVAEMRQKLKVEIYEDQLGKLKEAKGANP